VNILGVPFDGAVLGRKGAAEGPQAIRGAMSGYSNYNLELGVGLQGARIFDLGDLVVEKEDTIRAHSQIEAEVAGDLGETSMLVVMGGDNSVSLPCLRANAKRFGKLGLIAFDSHLDLRGKIKGKPTSGSSYGLAVETLDELEGRRVVEAGIHGFLNSESYFQRAKELGITVVTAGEVEEEGASAVARRAYAIASKGADAVYLSVDLDVVDISQVSGVSAPSVGGVSAGTLLQLVYLIAKQDKVKCADVVELAASLDPTGRSARVASAAVVYLMAGFASRKIGRARLSGRSRG
jgi:formimidoylglutamase